MKNAFTLAGLPIGITFGNLINSSSPDSPVLAITGALLLAAWAYGSGYTFAQERNLEEA